MQIRYIRDWLNGSNLDGGEAWIEIQAYTSDGTNVALNKSVVSSNASQTNLAVITDGRYSLNYASDYSASGGLTSVTIDLTQLYDVISLKIWHFYNDSRNYNNKTEVSPDGTNWTTVFDSSVSGTYSESNSGHSVVLPVVPQILKKYLLKSNGILYTIVNNAPSQISGTLNAALFQQYGVDIIPSSALLALPNPSILYWQSSSTDPLAGVYATVTAIPFPQVVITYEADMSDPTIAGIKSITPSLDVTGNGSALFAISFDGGTTYNAFTGTAWQTVDITSTDDFTAKGMTATILSAITQQQWSDFLTTHTTKKYKIAVLLNRPSIDDNIRIKSIQTLYLNQ